LYVLPGFLFSTTPPVHPPCSRLFLPPPFPTPPTCVLPPPFYWSWQPASSAPIVSFFSLSYRPGILATPEALSFGGGVARAPVGRFLFVLYQGPPALTSFLVFSNSVPHFRGDEVPLRLRFVPRFPFLFQSFHSIHISVIFSFLIGDPPLFFCLTSDPLLFLPKPQAFPFLFFKCSVFCLPSPKGPHFRPFSPPQSPPVLESSVGNFLFFVLSYVFPIPPVLHAPLCSSKWTSLIFFFFFPLISWTSQLGALLSSNPSPPPFYTSPFETTPRVIRFLLPTLPSLYSPPSCLVFPIFSNPSFFPYPRNCSAFFWTSRFFG